MITKFVVFEDDAQQLSNKTISANNNTISDLTAVNLKAQTPGDNGKTFLVQPDGSWNLTKLKQYKRVSTFTGVVGDVDTMYYLDTAYSTFVVGLYIYDSATNVFIPISSSGGVVVVDDVTIAKNASGALMVKDAGITIAKFNASVLSTVLPSGGGVDTKVPTEKAVTDVTNGLAKSLEFTMSTTDFKLTAVLKDLRGNILSSQVVDLPLEQMIVNVTYDNVTESFVFTLKDGSTITVPASGILKGVVTQTGTQELTNKTINADSNTLTNISPANLKSQTILTDEGKTLLVKQDGTWEVGKVKQYKLVHTFTGVAGDVSVLYYLDTAYSTFATGLYIFNGTSFIPVFTSTPISYDNITIGVDGAGALCVKDNGIAFAKLNSSLIATSISQISTDTTIPTAKAVFDAAKVFGKSLTGSVTTDKKTLKVNLHDAAGTIISTANIDMSEYLADYIKSITYDNSSKKFIITHGNDFTTDIDTASITAGLVVQDATQTITNKTINATNNTIINVDNNNLKPQTASDIYKVMHVTNDGTWVIGNLPEYHIISDLSGAGNTKFLYYLDTPDGTNPIGWYIYNGTSYTYANSQNWVNIIGKPFDDINTSGLMIDAENKLAVSYGDSEGTVCQGNDTRLSDARTPTAHAISHTDGTDDIVDATSANKGLLTAADWNTFNNKQEKCTSAVVTLVNGSWDTSSKTQTVSVTGATAANTIFTAPDGASYTNFVIAQIRCTAQGEGTLTFTCTNLPSTDINVNVVIFP